ncbi:EF-hand domain-containing protein [uncultured Litoreibacter sp.]|uniref:EF-hand domain-containing protein n=1 Tax=uncultured Litoreibacter sp. TaxID=1392394 RepID=UPI0026300AC5|nr:EF-hand domain-containing protein [uncultured Litoreibacter sp.]
MTKTMTAAKTILLAAGVAVAMVPTASFAKGEGRGNGPRITFEALDSDGNGEVTKAEMEAAADARFANSDSNGDGFLTKEELTSAANGRAEKRIERMFKRRDANDDGKLSTTELRPSDDRAAERFARADTDNSGGISKEEFEAAKKSRHGRRKPASE